MELIFAVLLIFSCSGWISAIPSAKGLHSLMDEKELKFYFGSDENLPDYEIVDLPENLASGYESVVDEDGSEDSGGKNVNFRAFGRQIDLNLFPNKHLISPHAKEVRKRGNSTVRMPRNFGQPNFCHFLHVNADSVASISNCDSKEIHGLIFLANDTLEILPITSRLKSIFSLREYKSGTTKTGKIITKIPHLIKISYFDPNDDRDFTNDFIISSFRVTRFPPSSQITRGVTYDQPLVELGLFFDEAFYKFFAEFFEFDDEKLRNFILSYINSMQSLYHHESLGRRVDFTIVYLEIMEEQPPGMPHANGERNALIDNFCHYQKKLNVGDDRNPEHWDMAVYVSALDFFAWEANGAKNGATMGLATVGGVCNDDFNCIISEFGSVNRFGRPYPSSGFTSVYILAHEIGHNLGMSHDSVGNSCSKEGFVMSPSRGTQGETTWSWCSSSVVRKLDWAKCLYDRPSSSPSNLDPWMFSGYPGVSYNSKDQCEILLRDREAFAFVNGHQSSICDNLHCRSASRPGFFFAGPALQGTECGLNRWCEGGKCVNRKQIATSTTTTTKPSPTWGPCKSECLTQGKGTQKLQNHEDHDGLMINVCDDRKICSTRKSVNSYGTEKCREFSKIIPEIDPNGFGLQASYDSLRLWMSCAIYCKKKNSRSYFAPRAELNDMGVSPYFPDGTFCHREGNENFYCLNAHCLPESTKLLRSAISV